MKNNLHGFIRGLSVLGLTMASFGAHALSCMVVGEKTARVQSGEGEKSPAFLSNACETLRLVSGKAMVSWVARDGKAIFSPIGPQGVSQLPAAGAAERSASVVWAEMTSKRETTRPAFMRALDQQRPARVFIPAEGLIFPSSAGTALSIKLIEDQSEKVVTQKSVGDGALRVTREGLSPGVQFVVELSGGPKPERWLLRRVNDADAAQIESQLATINQAEIDVSQRQILKAMLYEQLKLPVNMALTAPTAQP